MPVPLIDDDSQVNDTFRSLVESALRTSLPSTLSLETLRTQGHEHLTHQHLTAVSAGLGGEQLRSWLCRRLRKSCRRVGNFTGRRQSSP
jgi:hypothetical protein